GLLAPAAAAPPPDLSIALLRVDGACRIQLRIKNAGGPLSAVSHGAAQASIDTGLTLHQVALSRIDSGGALRSPGGTVQYAFKHALPTAGSVKVTLDANRVVREKRENNNSRRVAVPATCWQLTRSKKAVRPRARSRALQLNPATMSVKHAARRFEVQLATGVDNDARWHWTARVKNTGTVKIPIGSIALEGTQRSPSLSSGASGGVNPWSLDPGQARSVKLYFNPCAYAYGLALTAKDAQTRATLETTSVALPQVKGSDLDVSISFDQPNKRRRILVVNRSPVAVKLGVQCVFRDATSVHQSKWTEKPCGGIEMRLRPNQGNSFDGPVAAWQPGMRGVIFAMIYRNQDASNCGGDARKRIAVESLVLPIVGWQPDG
ncbi:MAG TPA: hypothetical protein PKD61_26725, partial [Polyangiaceae bacterium]|nr:hypothetical protein [Polyangiaceae bacterium]